MNLLEIPGVGKKTKQGLIKMGYYEVEDLINVDPEKLYEKYNNMVGYTEDRCQLYVYRCAIYFANNLDKLPKDIHWWDFKDKK